MRAMIFLAAGLSVLASSAQADAIDDAFAPWTGNDRPGCTIAMARADDAPTVRAYGMADLERQVALTPDSVFESGSVAKQVTAAAVLMLVEDGRLSLADDIRKYLPEMPDYGATITIDHLLTHTSGLRDWSDLVDFTGWPRYSRAYSNADALLILSRQRALNHRPGERFAYTNSGYNLLAIIVERATGQSLAALTAERLFAPLGMTHSGWRDDYRRIVPNRAVGYVRDGDGFRLGMPMENAHGSGGMLTTAADLLRWVQALERGTLGPFVTHKLEEPATLDDGRTAAYGRGLVLGRYRGQREIFHNGGTNGYQAWAGRYPEQRLSIALLCNGRTVGPDTQTRKVAALHLPEPPARAVLATPADELHARPGLYIGRDGFEIIELDASDGALRTANGGVLAFVAAGRYRLGTGEIRFTAAGLERHLADGEVRAFDRAERLAAAGDLAALAGRYVSDEVNGRYDLERDGSSLRLTPVDRPEATLRLTPLVRDGFLGDGYLMRVRRDARGRPIGLRFQTSRVYALDFVRVAAAAR